MQPNLDQERRHAHALLDALPAEKLNAVRTLLEVWWSPWPAHWRLLRWKRRISLQTPPPWISPVFHSLMERASRTTKSSANSA